MHSEPSFIPWRNPKSLVTVGHESRRWRSLNYGRLRQIDAAANEFALEDHRTNGSPINFPNDLTPYIKLNSAGKIPGCPQGGIYSLKQVGATPTCSLGTNIMPAHYLPQ
jgi:hypothetical protein